jgi:hypothetical protein
MVMLPIHGYTDIMLICIVISLWLSSSPFKLNLTLIELEQICWLSHGATESSSSVQPHLPGWGGPNSVYCHASRRYLQLGKVMCACYPDQVGGHSFVCPSCMDPESPFGTVFILATTVAARMVADVTSWHQGHPWHIPKGSLSEWPGECHAIRLVLSECRWSTRMGARGHEFRGVGTVY